MSNIVFLGFMAAWFFADSPISLSCSVNETNEGVVKFPCSLATECCQSRKRNRLKLAVSSETTHERTDFHAGSFIVCDARIRSAYHIVQVSYRVLHGPHTQVNANGALVDLIRHISMAEPLFDRV